MKDILSEIVERRIEDINRLGIEFGFSIPQTRQRPVHEFLPRKGVILEVKRASPSKGAIAPDLDSAATALSYAKAGAAAISCLTESNYFKGNLEDLMKVAKALDDFEKENGKRPALLRKDFLLNEEEVEVAYRAGADAVLLIARILDQTRIVEMAKAAAAHKMTSLVEVRSEEDLEKLALVAKAVSSKYLVCGVNSRDLATFKIDLLKPCSLLAKIKGILGEDARVIFESGIRSPEAAAFAGSLGFTGMLLGEAAAREPEIRKALVESFVNAVGNKNADFWNLIATRLVGAGASSRPLVKICGITNKEDGLKAAELGADFLGFIFHSKSPRNTSADCVKEVREALGAAGFRGAAPRTLLVGVIVNPQSPEAKTAISLVRQGILDAIQLHTAECALSFLSQAQNRELPHYAAVNLKNEKDLEQMDKLFMLGQARILIDAYSQGVAGGSGKRIDEELVKLAAKKYQLWMAGGIGPENIKEINNKFSPELVDLSSSLESQPGKKDFSKLEAFFSTCYY